MCMNNTGLISKNDIILEKNLAINCLVSVTKRKVAMVYVLT